MFDLLFHAVLNRASKFNALNLMHLSGNKSRMLLVLEVIYHQTKNEYVEIRKRLTIIHDYFQKIFYIMILSYNNKYKLPNF